MSLVFAATHPERTVALVLYGTLARYRRDVDYPWGNEQAQAEMYRIFDEGLWGTGESLRVFAPSLMGDDWARENAARRERAGGSPGTMRTFVDSLVGIDVRAVLPTISAPTLVIHATDDFAEPIGNGRWLAKHIAGARFVEVPGEHSAFDVDRFADEVESFLTGRRPVVASGRVLATVMFTDIVSSTEHAARLGDRAWSQVLDRHDAIVRRELERHRGRPVNPTGDGVLATFDGPARGVRCAEAIIDAIRPLGIDVRAGLHTGEVEVRGDDIGGIAVHIGQRISGLAGPGEVLVSRTVTDLVTGSGLEFEDRGEHPLKGVPGRWQLFAVLG